MIVAVTATEAVSSVRTGDPTGIVRALSLALVRVVRPFPSGHEVWDAEAPPRGSARPIQSPSSTIRAETSTNAAGETVALPRSFGGISLPERSEAPRSEPEDSPGPQKGWVLPVDVADDLLSGKVPQVVRAEGVPRDELFGRPAGKSLRAFRRSSYRSSPPAHQHQQQIEPRTDRLSTPSSRRPRGAVPTRLSRPLHTPWLTEAPTGLSGTHRLRRSSWSRSITPEERSANLPSSPWSAMQVGRSWEMKRPDAWRPGRQRCPRRHG
jgi:hypothetical protein